MEVRGICSICGKAGKMHTCSFCGNLVCSGCFIPQRGICQRCQQGLKFHNGSRKEG